MQSTTKGWIFLLICWLMDRRPEDISVSVKTRFLVPQSTKDEASFHIHSLVFVEVIREKSEDWPKRDYCWHSNVELPMLKLWYCTAISKETTGKTWRNTSIFLFYMQISKANASDQQSICSNVHRVMQTHRINKHFVILSMLYTVVYNGSSGA